MTDAALLVELEQLRKRAERERRARQEAELLAEEGMRQLYARQRQLELLHVIADAANAAASIEAAIQGTLNQICAHTGWPVGHAYLVEENSTVTLVPAALWHLDHPERFAAFRKITEATRFQRGEGLPGTPSKSVCAARSDFRCWLAPQLWRSLNFFRVSRLNRTKSN